MYQCAGDLLGTNLYPAGDDESRNDNGISIKFSEPVEDKNRSNAS